MSDSERERAAIVKWLRSIKVTTAIEPTSGLSVAWKIVLGKDMICDQTATALDIADAIERGDHMEATNET